MRRRHHIHLALAATSVGLTVAACTSFSGSDSQVDPTKDSGAVTNGDGGAAADGEPLDGGGVQNADAGTVAACAAMNQSKVLFCNDFDDAGSESMFSGGPYTFDPTHVNSLPTSLHIESATADYVLFAATQFHAAWTLSFWVYLDAVPDGTEFAYVEPTTTQMVFKRSKTGVTVDGQNFVLSDGWVHAVVQSTGGPNLDVTLTPGGTKGIPFANTTPLKLALGRIAVTSAFSGPLWFDDVAATVP